LYRGGVTFPAVINTLAVSSSAGAITIAGPEGSVQLPATYFLYSAQLGGGPPPNAQPLFLNPGTYTISGDGGTTSPLASLAVAPFSQDITIPAPLIWTNQSTIDTVVRSQPLDVTWSGGDPNGTVQITAYDGEGFICNVRTSDQHFTIPAFVLSSFPANPNGQLRMSAQSTTPFTITLTATDSFTDSTTGVINSIISIGKNVSYQ